MSLAEFKARFPHELNMLRSPPGPEWINIVKRLMGDGERGVWTGTRLNLMGYDSVMIMFSSRWVDTGTDDKVHRFCIRHHYVPKVAQVKTMLIYTAAMVAHDLSEASCGFMFNSLPEDRVVFRLEAKGPDGKHHPVTSLRARLRAVIGALKFRDWSREGWSRIVVITSDKIVSGATTDIREWVANRSTYAFREGWDLWELLSTVLGEYAGRGC
ncbi:ribonuclease H-like domain-containing protein [Nemania sp. FL0031]|nr:ribonuclease H-like domain-containing protein [Nemania sp. FL0031]